MRRRSFLLVLLPLAAALAGEGREPVRGKLTQRPDQRPALETPGGKLVLLGGDKPTLGVLNDKRLAGADLEVVGRFQEPELLVVDPIHTKAVFVHKDGKRYLITYWCETCAIRTYSPGLCWCCREETELDLREYKEP